MPTLETHITPLDLFRDGYEPQDEMSPPYIECQTYRDAELINNPNTLITFINIGAWNH